MNKAIANINILDKNECCGCGACYNTCPVDAIAMEYNEEGFLCPTVDEDKCVSCGRCQTCCPSLKPQYRNSHNPECYAVLAHNKIRKVSSSGGMFSLLAEYVLSKNGYVCGAAYGKDFEVKHIIIDSLADMHLLRGSKYVQSSTGTVYREIKRLLDDGNWVLFSGTPCQVAGINGYLKNDYDKLLTVDIVCHGVPSPQVFQRYLKENYVDTIKSIHFRTKDFGYTCTTGIIEFENGNKHIISTQNDMYEQGFHKSVFLRRSCENCPYALIPRQADFTIGDFWGISQYDPSLNDQMGTSLVLLNTKKSVMVFHDIKNNAKRYEAVPLEYAKKNNRFAARIKTHEGRARFFELIKNNLLDRSLYYAINNRFDVAIYGVWYGCNYGSIMTYYALCRIIESFGLSVLMIDKPIIRDNDIERTMTHSRRFAVENYKEISRQYHLWELQQLNRYCDIFVIGSDQVWNYGISKSFGRSNFFDFVEEDKKKISYAASFGHARIFSDMAETQITANLLHRFDHISVREADGVSICKKNFGVNATQVLDPVFLCDQSFYDEIAARSMAEEKENYIATYILDPTPEKRKALIYVSEQLNMKLINMLDGAPGRFEANEAALNLEHTVRDLQVEDWLYYIKNCKFLITDSCHGVSFGIIFRKPFISISNPQRGASRFRSLLSLFGLEGRNVNDPLKIMENKALLGPVDYESVYATLERERERSLAWLKNALFSEKNVKGLEIYPKIDNRLVKEKPPVPKKGRLSLAWRIYRRSNFLQKHKETIKKWIHYQG